MARYRLIVRYDGTDFAGSQANPGSRTVDGTLKAELEKIAGQPVHLLWAGRTDCGVHAEGNVAAFDAELAMPADNLSRMLNARLPDDLEVRSAAVVPDEFHPRFDALRREYLYRVYLGSDVPVDRQRYTTPYVGEWQPLIINDALDLLTGEHCFVNFCQRAVREQGMKHVRQAAECFCTLERPRADYAGNEVCLYFGGNRFLRNMIRRLMAALFAVNEGAVNLKQLADALGTTETDLQLKPAPAKGLTLMSVEYGGEASGSI